MTGMISLYHIPILQHIPDNTPIQLFQSTTHPRYWWIDWRISCNFNPGVCLASSSILGWILTSCSLLRIHFKEIWLRRLLPYFQLLASQCRYCSKLFLNVFRNAVGCSVVRFHAEQTPLFCVAIREVGHEVGVSWWCLYFGRRLALKSLQSTK